MRLKLKISDCVTVISYSLTHGMIVLRLYTFLSKTRCTTQRPVWHSVKKGMNPLLSNLCSGLRTFSAIEYLEIELEGCLKVYNSLNFAMASVIHFNQEKYFCGRVFISNNGMSVTCAMTTRRNNRISHRPSDSLAPHTPLTRFFSFTPSLPLFTISSFLIQFYLSTCS